MRSQAIPSENKERESIGFVCINAGLDGGIGGSMTASGIARRNGMGKPLHMRVQALWVQETRTEG